MKNFDDVCCGNIFLLYHLNIRLTVDKPMSYSWIFKVIRWFLNYCSELYKKSRRINSSGSLLSSWFYLS